MHAAESTAPSLSDGRRLLQVAWPLIINAGTFAALNFFDRLFLSWYSEDAFRAALPSGILFFTLVCGFMAVAGFTGTFVAHYWGAGDRLGCSRATAQGIIFSLIAFPLILALTPLGVFFLRLSGHAPDVQEMEIRYLRILMGCGGGMTLSAALGGFFSGRGKTRVVMSANILANAVNILLNYAFIFGKWGFPRAGIVGAGWASVIGAWIAPVIFAALYFSPAVNAQFATRRTLRFDPPLFRRLLRFGLPAGIHWVLDVAAFTTFVLLLGRLGEIAHVAGNIALSINLIAFMPMTGIGLAAGILVGQHLGEGDPRRAERIALLALRIGLGYIAVIGLTFLLFPDLYIAIFENGGHAMPHKETLYRTVRRLLALLAVWGLADAVSIILSGVLKGAGDTRFVMIFQSLLAWGFLVPGQLWIVLHLRAGLFVSWGWTLLYIILLAAGFALRFRSRRWQRIDLLERGKTAPFEAVESRLPIE